MYIDISNRYTKLVKINNHKFLDTVTRYIYYIFEILSICLYDLSYIFFCKIRIVIVIVEIISFLTRRIVNRAFQAELV